MVFRSLFRAPYSNSSGRRYDVFVSYAHEDKSAADRIQQALERFCRPIFGLRSMRVFRDATDMSATELNQGVSAILEQSDTLLLIASKASAKSPWVRKELTTFWKRRRLLKEDVRVCVVLVDGTTPWTDEGGVFAERCTAINRHYARILFKSGIEPYVFDLRQSFKSDKHLDPKAFELKNAVASMAALVWNADKRDLFGRQRKLRQQFQISGGIAIVIVFLGLLTGIQTLLTLGELESKRFATQAENQFQAGAYDRSLRVALASFQVGGLFGAVDESIEWVLARANSASKLASAFRQTTPISRLVFANGGEVAAGTVGSVGDSGRQYYDLLTWTKQPNSSWTSSLIARLDYEIIELVYSPSGDELVSLDIHGRVSMYSKEPDGNWRRHIFPKLRQNAVSHIKFAPLNNDLLFMSTGSGLWLGQRIEDGWRLAYAALKGRNLTGLEVSKRGDRVLVNSNVGLAVASKSRNQPWQVVPLTTDGAVRQFAFFERGRIVVKADRLEVWSRELKPEKVLNQNTFEINQIVPGNIGFLSISDSGAVSHWARNSKNYWAGTSFKHAQPQKFALPQRFSEWITISTEGELLNWHQNKQGWAFEHINHTQAKPYQLLQPNIDQVVTLSIEAPASFWNLKNEELTAPTSTANIQPIASVETNLTGDRLVAIVKGEKGTELQELKFSNRSWQISGEGYPIERYSKLLKSDELDVMLTFKYETPTKLWQRSLSGKWQFKQLGSGGGRHALAANGKHWLIESSGKPRNDFTLWSKSQGGWSKKKVPTGGVQFYDHMAVSNDGETILAAPSHGSALLFQKKLLDGWDNTILQKVLTVGGPPSGDLMPGRELSRSALSPDGTLAVLQFNGLEPMLFTKNIGRWTHQVLSGSRGDLTVHFRSGKIIFLTGKIVQIWSKDNFSSEWTSESLIGHHSKVSKISISIDGSRIVTSDSSGSIRVWMKNSIGLWASQQVGHQNELNVTPVLDGEGNTITTLSASGKIEIWRNPMILPENRDSFAQRLLGPATDELPRAACKKLVGHLSIVTSTDVADVPLLARFEGTDVCGDYR